jgi:hypothetical protein
MITMILMAFLLFELLLCMVVWLVFVFSTRLLLLVFILCKLLVCIMVWMVFMLLMKVATTNVLKRFMFVILQSKRISLYMF